jgi:hypothetical protein
VLVHFVRKSAIPGTALRSSLPGRAPRSAFATTRPGEKGAADRPGVGPGIQLRLPADFPFATSDRVDGRHRCAERRVANSQERKQLSVEIILADRDQIDDRQTDVLQQQIEALGRKQLPALGPILVGRTDNFNGRYQTAIAFEIKDQDFDQRGAPAQNSPA